MYVTATLSGCASFRPTATQEAVPEQVSTYVLLVYELPFVYEKNKPPQETFLSVIREVVAPADWENGPDSMTAVMNMLVVNTTPKNHMRLERFFDSLPDFPAQHPEAWTKQPKKTKESE
ncbi:MAG: hypothetical protein PVI74_14345 [Syntrophobacterales bacterium]|jgi:hypothetical protein